MNFETRNTPPVTMADVAICAAVHVSTVSRALRDDPGLPESTRQHVKNIARGMGYRPNPFVAALIASRRSQKRHAFRATIGYVTHVGPEVSFSQDYEVGVREAAQALGFNVDTFVLGEDGLDASRLDSVLRARNITAVVIGPLAQPDSTFELDWSRLSTVVIGYAFNSPSFDRVVHDHYASMVRILAECERRRLKDIGIVLNAMAHHRTKRMITAAYWSRLESSGFLDAVPPLIVEAWDDDVFNAWRAKHRPEVIVVTGPVHAHVQACLAQDAAATGRDTFLINVNAGEDGPVSGIFQDPAGIGATAARMVIAKAFRNESGVPAAAQIVLTPGKWIEGATLGFAARRGALSIRSA